VFETAIENAAQYTRPLHTIVRHYGSTIVEPGAATLFFVNQDGWALTCKHVAHLLIAADQIGARRVQFRQELGIAVSTAGRKKLRKELAKKYGFKSGQPFEIYNNFINCVQGALDAEIRLHQSLDIALLHFRNFQPVLFEKFPTFAADGDSLKQGKFLCRLGFPFAEFTNFEYDSAADETRWVQTGRLHTPRFPIEGMVTRHLADPAGNIVGFETSTPGLRGQSGGPAFDSSELIWGMQSATNHLDLNFDVDLGVVRAGRTVRVKDNAFLHVGHCVHVNALKDFMRQNTVQFQEG
jgi:hypothetical protein